MPTSYYLNVPWVMDLVARLAPRSILDVGAGSGRYGFLFREQMTFGQGGSRRGGTIDAIEIHADYLTDMHRCIYDRVHVGPAEQVIDSLGQYDLVFLGEVIEHLPKPAGQSLLRKAFDHARQAVVLTTPAVWLPQGEMFANPAERHVSMWGPGDFADYPNRVCRRLAGQTLLAVLGRPGVALPRNLTPEPLRPWPRFKRWCRLRLGLAGRAHGPEDEF